MEENMTKRTTNQVRQVLMNELGLSRQTVREEMERIISDVIEKHLSTLMRKGWLKNAVRQSVEKEFNKQGRDTIGYIIRTAIQAEVNKFVRENIRINSIKDRAF